MKRWNNKNHQFVTVPHVDAFIADLLEVCKKHNLSIGHEDSHGAFIVEEFSEDRADWLCSAHDETTKRRTS